MNDKYCEDCQAHSGVKAEIKALGDKVDMIENYLKERIGDNITATNSLSQTQGRIIIGLVILGVIVSFFAPTMTPILLAAL